MATRRKLASGKYQFIIRITGHKPVSQAFNTIAAGNKWARTTEDSIRSGTYYRMSNTMRVSDLITQYVDSIKYKSTYRADRYTAPLLVRHFQHYTIGTLPAVAIRAYIDAVIASGKTTGTARRHIGLLSRALTYAQKDLDIQFKNPMQNIRLPSNKQQTSRRAITQDEQKQLLKHMTPEMQKITVLAIETAMRRGEILRIEPHHIDLEKHTLHIPITKTNTPRTIPLSGKAYAILKDFTAWSIGIHSVTKYFRRACRDAGITGLCFHCTRHTGVSRLAEVLTPIQVAAISGHKSGRMLLHYSHPDIEALAKRLG